MLKVALQTIWLRLSSLAKRNQQKQIDIPQNTVGFTETWLRRAKYQCKPCIIFLPLYIEAPLCAALSHKWQKWYFEVCGFNVTKCKVTFTFSPYLSKVFAFLIYRLFCYFFSLYLHAVTLKVVSHKISFLCSVFSSVVHIWCILYNNFPSTFFSYQETSKQDSYYVPAGEEPHGLLRAQFHRPEHPAGGRKNGSVLHGRTYMRNQK